MAGRSEGFRRGAAGALVLALAGAALVATFDLRGSAGQAEPPFPVDDSPVSWQGVVEVATGEAYQGPWRMNASDFRYVDAPTVALDGEGSAAVAWVDQARKDVLFQLYVGDGTPTLDEPVNVSRSPDTFSWLPRLVVESPERIHVLWQEIVFSGGSHGGEIFYAASSDGGLTFSEPRNLSNTPAGAGKGRLSRAYWHNGSLDLALTPEGNLVAAWTEYEGALRVSLSDDGGAGFSEPLRVDREGDRLPARGPTLAVGPDGLVLLAWTVGEDPGADLRLAVSRDGGRTFGEPRRILEGPGHADAPKLAVDGEGTLHLTYAEGDEGPSGRYRVRYVRSPDGGRTFEEPSTVSSRPSDEGREPETGAGFPHLALEGGGTVYVVWEIFPDPSDRPRGLAMAVSTDGGESFSSPSLIPGTYHPDLGFNGSLQGLLMRKLAADGEGRVAVVNGTFRQGEESRIRLVLGRGPDES